MNERRRKDNIRDLREAMVDLAKRFKNHHDNDGVDGIAGALKLIGEVEADRNDAIAKLRELGMRMRTLKL